MDVVLVSLGEHYVLHDVQLKETAAGIKQRLADELKQASVTADLILLYFKDQPVDDATAVEQLQKLGLGVTTAGPADATGTTEGALQFVVRVPYKLPPWSMFLDAVRQRDIATVRKVLDSARQGQGGEGVCASFLNMPRDAAGQPLVVGDSAYLISGGPSSPDKDALSSGGDASTTTTPSEEPLHDPLANAPALLLACAQRDAAMVTLLLAHGARPDGVWAPLRNGAAPTSQRNALWAVLLGNLDDDAAPWRWYSDEPTPEMLTTHANVMACLGALLAAHVDTTALLEVCDSWGYGAPRKASVLTPWATYGKLQGSLACTEVFVALMNHGHTPVLLRTTAVMNSLVWELAGGVGLAVLRQAVFIHSASTSGVDPGVRIKMRHVDNVRSHVYHGTHDVVLDVSSSSSHAAIAFAGAVAVAEAAPATGSAHAGGAGSGVDGGQPETSASSASSAAPPSSSSSSSSLSGSASSATTAYLSASGSGSGSGALAGPPGGGGGGGGVGARGTLLELNTEDSLTMTNIRSSDTVWELQRRIGLTIQGGYPPERVVLGVQVGMGVRGVDPVGVTVLEDPRLTLAEAGVTDGALLVVQSVLEKHMSLTLLSLADRNLLTPAYVARHAADVVARIDEAEENTDSPLHYAVLFGNLPVAQALLAARAYVGQRGRKSRSVWHVLVESTCYPSHMHKIPMANLLLEYGGARYLHIRDQDAFATALDWGRYTLAGDIHPRMAGVEPFIAWLKERSTSSQAKPASEDIAKKAVDAGEIVLTVTPLGGDELELELDLLDTIDTFKAKLRATCGIPIRGDHDVFLRWNDRELQDGVRINEYGLKDGDTVRMLVLPAQRFTPEEFYKAVLAREVADLRMALDVERMDVNALHTGGYVDSVMQHNGMALKLNTVLKCAVAARDKEMVELLLEAKADVSDPTLMEVAASGQRRNFFRSPNDPRLAHCTKLSDLEMVRMLLDRGATVCPPEGSDLLVNLLEGLLNVDREPRSLDDTRALFALLLARGGEGARRSLWVIPAVVSTGTVQLFDVSRPAHAVEQVFATALYPDEVRTWLEPFVTAEQRAQAEETKLLLTERALESIAQRKQPTVSESSAAPESAKE